MSLKIVIIRHGQKWELIIELEMRNFLHQVLYNLFGLLDFYEGKYPGNCVFLE